MTSDPVNTVVSFEKGIDSMRLFGVRTKLIKTEDFEKGIRNWWRSFWCGQVKRIKSARKHRLPGYSNRHTDALRNRPRKSLGTHIYRPKCVLDCQVWTDKQNAKTVMSKRRAFVVLLTRKNRGFRQSISGFTGSDPIATYRTRRSWGLFLHKQWEAVRTHWGAIRVPPQKLQPRGLRSMACHGQSPGRAFVPPTIRVSGFMPHAPITKNKVQIRTPN